MIDCPRCSAKTAVIESRRTNDTIRRRRKCKGCGWRFTTYEVDASSFARLHIMAHSSLVADGLRRLSDMLKGLDDVGGDDVGITVECERLAKILADTYGMDCNVDSGRTIRTLKS